MTVAGVASNAMYRYGTIMCHGPLGAELELEGQQQRPVIF
jgi:hypothetical protein